LYRREHLPIDVIISPEREVAEAALRRLAAPAAFDTESFADDRVQLIGLTLEEDCAVINTPLRQLSELFSTLRAVVVGVRRDGNLFVPHPNDQLFVGDQTYLIVGGGNVGLYVSTKLEKGARRVHTKVIEKNRSQAETAADSLSRTVVLHGDGLDMDLLEEANIAKADALLAVTDDDKTNLLSCARAKALGCPLTIALINDPSLTTLMAPLGIDAFINPRATTVSSILRHIRHGSVRKVYSVGDAEAEVIEAQVMGTSPLSGELIRDIDWPEGAMVGAVIKRGEILVPRGDTRIEEGDVLVVFALSSDISVIEKLFQVNIEFF
jgi:trk system potassium uptake protein TrkA